MSGPARGRQSAPALPGRGPSLAARGLLVIRGLPEHTLLDRIVRGRAWIPLLGVLLAGIVAMQVEILKLGTSQGRWIQRSATLSTRNQALQASVAGLMDDQRIESLAAKMGMVMAGPTAVSFLSAQSGGDASRAAANIHAPDPSGFASQISTLAASAASSGGALGASGPPQDSSSSTSGATGTGAGSSSTTNTSSATSGASVASTGGGGTSSAQPVDTGGSSGGSQSNGPSSGSGSGSGGAASIAPPSSSSTGATGG